MSGDVPLLWWMCVCGNESVSEDEVVKVQDGDANGCEATTVDCCEDGDGALRVRMEWKRKRKQMLR